MTIPLVEADTNEKDENGAETADAVAIAVECEPSTVTSVTVSTSLEDNEHNNNDDFPLAVTKMMASPLEEQATLREQGIEHCPSIISATVRKCENDERKNTDPGLSFDRTDDGLRISSIDPKGLFSDAPIAEGDVVLSVNNDSCQDLSSRLVLRLIQRSKESVTLIVRRLEGDPYIVSTTVTKPTPESRFGIGVRCVDGSLCISSIDPHGLFAGGILNVGDKVVSIGGVPCSCMDSTSAIELIRKEEKRVTIVAWTEKEAGVVVAARNVSFGGSVRSLLWKWRKNIMIIAITFSIVAIIAIIVGTTSEKTPCEDLGQRPLPVPRECP